VKFQQDEFEVASVSLFWMEQVRKKREVYKMSGSY